MRANTFYKPDAQFLKTIGAAIRTLRKEKGLTIEDLAGTCSIHPKYIQGCETGRRNVSISILKDIVVKGLETDFQNFFAVVNSIESQ